MQVARHVAGDARTLLVSILHFSIEMRAECNFLFLREKTHINGMPERTCRFCAFGDVRGRAGAFLKAHINGIARAFGKTRRSKRVR